MTRVRVDEWTAWKSRLAEILDDAWFLALAIERERRGSTDLVALAEVLTDAFDDHLKHRAPIFEAGRLHEVPVTAGGRALVRGAVVRLFGCTTA